MKIIVPAEINDSVLLTSTVPENDYAAWNATATYATGDRVIRANTHRIYEAVAATTGDIPENSPTIWLDLGATNRWACFDEKIGTVTSATGSITMTLRPAVSTGIGIINAVADSIRVLLTDDTDGVVHDRTYSLADNGMISDWAAYFFDPISRKTYLVITDLPFYRNATVEITLNGKAGEIVSIGSLVIGTLMTFAPAINYGATVGIDDYSRKTRDDFGNVIVVERAFSKRARMELWITRSVVDSLQRTLARLRARPVVYVGADYESTIVYGFYKNFDITISYPTYSVCTIEIEGLV